MASLKGESGAVTWNWLKTWIPIIVLVVTLSAAWGVTSQRIYVLECTVVEQKAHIEKNDATLVEIQVQLAAIQRDVLYIRTAVDKK